MYCISAHHIGKSYGNVRALGDISFDVDPGEIYGIIGPDGAGKTTLLKLLLNIYPTESGGFFLESESCEGIRSARALTSGDRALFAYVSQKNF